MQENNTQSFIVVRQCLAYVHLDFFITLCHWLQVQYFTTRYDFATWYDLVSQSSKYNNGGHKVLGPENELLPSYL